MGWVGRTLLLMMCICCGLSLRADSPELLPAPAPAQRAFAIRQVNELCQRHPADYGPKRLLEMAGDEQSAAHLRFAAAYRAMEMAAASGDVKLSLSALSHLEQTYDVTSLKLREHLLKALMDASQRRAAVILAMRWSEDFYPAGDLKQVTPLARAVEKCRDDLSPALRAAADAYLEDYQHAMKADPAVVTCLYQQRWAEGLPHLAKIEHPLAELAENDLSVQADDLRMVIADRWWQAGEQHGGTTGWRIASRAIEIYRELLPRAGVIERELISSRLAEHESRRRKALGYLPGLSRQTWRENSSQRASGIAADLEIDRNDDRLELPRTGGHVLLRGYLLITEPGRHELTITAGSAIRMLVDGRVCLESSTIYRKRSGERVSLDLQAGLREMEIEVWASSSRPRLHVEWLTPGATEKRPIPQSSFFYDPLRH